MDLLTLFKKLPLELRYIVTNYDHSTPFRILSKSELKKYDWFNLIKINFSLTYSKTEATNEEIMRVYYDNCRSKKSKIACNENHTVIVNGKTLMGAGHGASGQLGQWQKEFSKGIFVKIDIGDVKDIVEVIAGGYNTIIRQKDGTLMICGSFSYDSPEHHRDPYSLVEIRGIPKNISSVTCGDQHIIIRLTDGTLMGCGYNKYGQLGLGDNKSRSTFVEIPGIPKNISSVTCGANNSIIKLTDGTLFVCGYNSEGQLGLSHNHCVNLFEEIKGLPKNIVQVVCGNHTIIRLSDGTLMSCGEDLPGDGKSRNTFEEIRGVPKNIAQVVCGSNFTIIKLTNGILMGSGSNQFGQLGFPECDQKIHFEKIPHAPKNIARINCGPQNTFIQLRNGKILSCGDNSSGQLGIEKVAKLTQPRFTNIKSPKGNHCTIS